MARSDKHVRTWLYTHVPYNGDPWEEETSLGGLPRLAVFDLDWLIEHVPKVSAHSAKQGTANSFANRSAVATYKCAICSGLHKRSM